MKKKDLSGIRSKTSKELYKLVEKKSLEYAKVRAAIKAGQEKNLKKVKLIRHDISQILTVIKEKEIVDKLENMNEKKIVKKRL
jgi:ribosomal protein L29